MQYIYIYCLAKVVKPADSYIKSKQGRASRGNAPSSRFPFNLAAVVGHSDSAFSGAGADRDWRCDYQKLITIIINSSNTSFTELKLKVVFLFFKKKRFCIHARVRVQKAGYEMHFCTSLIRHMIHPKSIPIK